MKTREEGLEEARREMAKMQGFKQSELQPCLVCGKGMAHSNDLDFYRVTLERFFLDYGAVRRQVGLEMSMGAAAVLASIMGPDEDIAKEPSPHASFLICGPCSMKEMLPLGVLSGRLSDREGEGDSK